MSSMVQPIILIVDDDPDAREILFDRLSTQPYQLYCAADGYEALELITQVRPDLILMDLMMPGISGIEVCRRLRSEARTAEVPIIIITALDDRATAINAIEAGADDLLTKPYDLLELQARVRTITRLNRYRRLIEEQERAQQADKRLVWAMDRASDGFLIVDSADQLVYANARARQFLEIDDGTALSEINFLQAISSRFQCAPTGDWVEWLHTDLHPRYLIRPESQQHAAQWISVTISSNGNAADGNSDRVIWLCDVSEDMRHNHAGWTLSGAVAHKLRTPLVGIIGSLSLTTHSWERLDTSERHEFVQMALQSAKQLHNQVEQIVRLSQPLSERLYDCCSVQQLGDLALNLASELHLHIDPPQLHANVCQQLPISTAQVDVILRELFTNARKFHPQQQPHLSLRVQRNPEQQIVIEISDDGVWLPPETLDQVWKPFYQVEKQFTGQISGMGLGLAMIARVLWSIGGNCWLENRRDTPGIVVVLQIPPLEPNREPYTDILGMRAGV